MDDCDAPARGEHGLCNKHRLRQQRRGRLVGRLEVPWQDRFWAKVRKGEDCWEWQGGRNSRGYGVFYKDGRRSRQELAHRVSYELAYGPIPSGVFACHSCDNPPCVHPDHLFLGTGLDNSRDSTDKGRHRNQKKTHCPQGHPYSGENLYVVPTTGRRQCRTCIYIRQGLTPRWATN